ncbi:unnamed protein product, partial [Nippostrongylus brasiliensis]|uniref:THADA armadillo repeat containing n=1 Tax=Nippostrongylus brasiliensis TaxID=27835 RepID=A0A0N4XJF0_NIPBR
MKEFMQVLGLINFVGTDIKASNELTDQYFSLLSKFLLKLGPLSRAVSSLPVNACSQNIPFHVALFTWSTACGVLREQDLGKLVSRPGGFFAFFAQTISHFVDIQAIVADEIMARFVLMFGMGDLLCDSELLTTCKVLLSFTNKCNLKGFAKIRRFATKFITKILQTVDTLDVPELDKLGRGKPIHWAENVLSSFKYCTAEETSLIVFLTRLLSDEQLSSCRSIVINRYSGVKLLVSGCVLSSMLSMLLSLVAGINDSRELAMKVCEWITAAVLNASESQCNTFFNALDVLASLTSRENAGNAVNVHGTVVN